MHGIIVESTKYAEEMLGVGLVEECMQLFRK